MIRVGVTGGIGSGKSTVCEMFAALGAPVYYSDARAREIMNGSGDVRQAIVALLGPGAYLGAAGGDGLHGAGEIGEGGGSDCDGSGAGTLDSAYVADKVFRDSELLARLNAIVHPAVAMDFEVWALAFGDRPYVVLESAILFESGFDRLVDQVITVSAPVDVRVERVMAREKNMTLEQALRRVENQLTDDRREARADYRIDNAGTREDLARQVQLIDNQLKINQ